MEKRYLNVYPGIEQEQFNLTRALISMLNCRRYLESEGFEDFVKKGGLGDPFFASCICGNSGKIFLDNGSYIGGEEFGKISDTKIKNDIIEKMIQGNPKLHRGGSDFAKDSVVRTAMGSNVCSYNDIFRFFLGIKDSKEEKEQWFIQTEKAKLKSSKRITPPSEKLSEQFAFEYMMYVRKDLISDADINEFTKYQQGLENIMKENSLLIYSPQVPQRKRPESKGVNNTKVETNFINPWEVQIPKLGKNG